MSGDTPIPTKSSESLTIPEVVREARLRLSPVLWDFASGGAESEATLRRNVTAMETIAFQPRILRQAARPDLRTTVLGQDVASPVLLAPIGSISSFHADGAVAAARAAHERGTVSFVGTLASPSLETVAERSSGPLVFQLYVRGDRAWLSAVVRAAEDAGYMALCLTADSTGAARRERDIHNRFQASRPARPNLPPGGDPGTAFQRSFSWDDFDWLRDQTRLPIIVKGVLGAADATLAAEHGADAVYVSNHGGRELDHLPSTIEVLPEVVAAVGGRLEVFVDSGFTRGTDVVKALALGANAVLIGKLQVWALAAGGVDCLTGTLRTLDAEMEHTLRLLGVSRVADLSPAYLRPTLPPAGRPPVFGA